MYEPELVYTIRGAIFDISNHTTGNWPEEAFENMLFDALTDKGLTLAQQKEYEIFYKDNRVGLYRTDLIVDDKVILELKVVPEIYPLHQAQTISYLKVTGLPLAMLVNFGSPELYIKIFPNKVSQKNVLSANFDINAVVNLPPNDKKLIYPYLKISAEILESLGPGFFHQVYRRAFWDELHYRNINFEWIKYQELKYQGRVYGKKEVRLLKIHDVLISIVAVNKFDELILKQFSEQVKSFQCQQGLIINFNNTKVDFRFLK